MYPVLFQLGSLQFYSYGFMIALSVITAFHIVEKEAIRFGWDVKTLNRLVLIDFVVAMVGSRILFILTQLSEPDVDILSLLFDVHAGFVYYGGVVSGALFVWAFTKYKRLPTWLVVDTFSLALCIAHAVGRVGCLLGGCCIGKPTQVPWGIVLKQHPEAGLLHPVQGYESLSLMILFAILWTTRKKMKYPGQLTVIFLGAYSIIRFCLEYFRGDDIRGFVISGVLSTSQFISILLLGVAFGLHMALRKKKI